jgi:chromosome segregation ATPase
MSEADAPEEDGDKEADELDLAYTQRIEMQLRNTEAKQNIPNECGIIQEISCTNFMCHEQLRVPLGPLINFIIGHNGSGKSAVLTALTLCLGGKAAATNRGQNLKSFIKEGRDHCSIRVKIKNEGSAAYRADLYGKSITVERHFTRAGTSGFKLKDENDRLVSIKKSDLEDIIDAFALQIDNPMNVLTQDNARQFLNDSSPKEKYKFFLKGTQLQALKEDYVLMESQLEEMQDKCLTLEADVGVLKSQFQEALAKAQRAHNLEQMAVREKLLAHQMAWAEVEVQEKVRYNVSSYFVCLTVCRLWRSLKRA